MPRLGAAHRSQRDRTIECHEPSFISDGQRDQVNVGQLAGTDDAVVVEKIPVAYGNAIGPKSVVGLGHLPPEQTDGETRRYRVGVAWLRDDTHESILGERARRPAFALVREPPLMRGAMMNMLLVQHSDEHVDVE